MEKKRLLYVDDEVINLELFKLMFEYKYDIITAISGEEGLRKYDKNPDIKLVISDMKMPVMDGLTFVKLLKQKNSQLPCVMLSGYAQTEQISEALSSGIIEKYITKPFIQEQMGKIIERLI